MKILFKFAMILISVLFFTGMSAFAQNDILDDIKVTVIYDNYLYKDGLKTDWGYSCLIEGAEKTILFDTGTKGDIFLHNVNRLDIDLKKVDLVIISHDHGDHWGGLSTFLKENPKVKVYMLKSFQEKTKNMARDAGAELIEITDPVKVCSGIYLTGEITGPVNEESIYIKTKKGTIVITGCAHPSVDKIVKKAKELSEDKILFVMGGFHLMRTPENRVKEIISNFKDMGVKYVSATHCTGDNAIEMFRKEYKDGFIKTGAGIVLTLADFK